MNTKTCTKCEIEKSIENFYLNRGKYMSCCQECVAIRRKEYYIKNKSEIAIKRAIYQAAHRKEQYAHTKAWRKRNVDKMREANRRQYANNPQHRQSVKNAWREANVDKIKAFQKKYRLNHLPKMAEKQHKRRAKMRSNGVYQISEKELIKLYSFPCIACGTTDRVTIDHIIPIARGGTHSIGNLQSLCLKCNSSKNHRTMSEWKFQVLLKRNQDGALCSYN
jgi:5-methylcytosine-specific restriction endonuclease McrA